MFLNKQTTLSEFFENIFNEKHGFICVPINLIIYKNYTYNIESILYRTDTKEILLNNKRYYNDDKIDGFLNCLKYLGIDYTIKAKFITPNDKLFNKFNFYDGRNDNEFIS